MIAKGRSIAHGQAALDYDINKQIDGQGVATEVWRNGLYGATGEDIVAEMAAYHADHPGVKNNCLRFEVSPSMEESKRMTDNDWQAVGYEFIRLMGLQGHQYIIVRHSGTEKKDKQAHLHILANRVGLDGSLYNDSFIGKRAVAAANEIAKRCGLVQASDIGKRNKQEIKQAIDEVLQAMPTFSLAELWQRLDEAGYHVREARSKSGKLNGWYVTSRSGTEYKASEIGKNYTIAHLEGYFRTINQNNRAMDDYRKKVQECASYGVKVIKGELGERWLADSFAELCELAGCGGEKERMHIVAQDVAIRSIHALSSYQLKQLDRLLDNFITNGQSEQRGMRR